METRQEQLCRLCLSGESTMHMNIFSEDGLQLKISDIIAEHFQCKVFEADPLPNVVCVKCWLKTKSFHTFHRLVTNAQQKFLENLEATETSGDLKKPHKDDEKEIKNVNRIRGKQGDPMDYPRSHSNKVTKIKTAAEDKLVMHYFDMSCDLCTDVFDTVKQARLHYQQVHNKADGYIKCCSRKFKKRNLVRDHINWHLHPDLYTCNQCNKIMGSKISLSKHMQEHIAKEKKAFICDICGKGFTRKPALREHLIGVHVKDGPKFECEFCKKLFPLKERLLTHVLSVHRPVNYKICDICGKSFKTGAKYRAHMQSHEDPATTRTQCKHCGEWLRSKSGIYYHKQLHTSGPQKCKECDEILSNRVTLLGHIRNKHREGKHKCHLCHKTYSILALLKGHIASHMGEHFKCTFCPKKFLSISGMRTHRKKSHPVDWSLNRAKKAATAIM